LASLVKQLDKVVADNSDKKLAAVVNFIDLDEDEVAKFAEKNEIKNVALTITDQKNADRFNVSEDADLTVMHYAKKEVKANHAVGKGKLNAKTAKAIVDSTSKILE
jgi:hypothetical protein